MDQFEPALQFEPERWIQQLTDHDPVKMTPTTAVYQVPLPAGMESLTACLAMPDPLHGWIVMGRSQADRRLFSLARAFLRSGLGVMHLDLLTAQEMRSRIPYVSVQERIERLATATNWLRTEHDALSAPLGYFGSHGDAAVALGAAAVVGGTKAVVSWEGRPDKVLSRLPLIRASTLLLVNRTSHFLLQINIQAEWWLRCVHKLMSIPTFAPIFPERELPHDVVHYSNEWYQHYLLPNRSHKSLPGQLLAPRHMHGWTSVR